MVGPAEVSNSYIPPLLLTMALIVGILASRHLVLGLHAPKLCCVTCTRKLGLLLLIGIDVGRLENYAPSMSRMFSFLCMDSNWVILGVESARRWLTVTRLQHSLRRLVV